MQHKKRALLVAAIFIASVLLLFTCVCFHQWIPATCAAPMTCAKCGKIDGEALSHEWVAATCSEARHCLLCGVADGIPLDHTLGEATCETAKTCSVCGATEGDPLGHAVPSWEITCEATCAAEGERIGTCDRCGKECVETIEMLPHTNSEWRVKSEYVIHSDGKVSVGTEEIVCVVCQKQLETRAYSKELTLSQKNAAICAYEEINYWHCGPDFLVYEVLVDFNGYSHEDANLVVSHMSVDWDKQAILFAKENIEGTSRTNLISEMRYYGFSNAQIELALKEVGY